jgi:hypothetical protein
MEHCRSLFFTGGLSKHVPVTTAHYRQFGDKGTDGLRFGWLIHVSFDALWWKAFTHGIVYVDGYCSM